METKQRHSVVTTLSLIRKQSAAHLPIGHSFIPYDILVAVFESHSNGSSLTVKSLFASLPYSVMGLRYHFRKLIETGWLVLHPVDNDARVKQIKPTEKLIRHFELLSQSIAPLLNTGSFQHDN